MTNGTEDKRFKEVRHQVSDWLLAESWQVRDVTENAEGVAWAIAATDAQDKVIQFAQKSNKPDVLVMQGPITVGDPDQAQLGKDPREAESLAWDIRFQVLNMGLQFQGVSVPLKQIVLLTRVYTDGLTRNGFFERLDRLQNGVLAVIWMIRRKLDQPAPEEQANGLEIN